MDPSQQTPEQIGRQNRLLIESLHRHPRITLRPHVFVRDLVLHEGRCVGAVGLQNGKSEAMEIAIEAATTVVATGGTGQIFRETTNPTGASGDGQALCFRALHDLLAPVRMDLS